MIRKIDLCRKQRLWYGFEYEMKMVEGIYLWTWMGTIFLGFEIVTLLLLFFSMCWVRVSVRDWLTGLGVFGLWIVKNGKRKSNSGDFGV